MSDNKIRAIDRMLASFVPRFITPNSLTAFRLVSIPFIAALFLMHQQKWAISLFLLAALTDAFDGALARARNQISEWGTKYDPLADKLLVIAGTIFIVLEYTPAWMACTVLTMEIVIVGCYFLFKKRPGFAIRPNACGKGKMVFQAAGIVLLGLYGLAGTPILLRIGITTMALAIGLGALSLAGYAYRLAIK